MYPVYFYYKHKLPIYLRKIRLYLLWQIIGRIARIFMYGVIQHNSLVFIIHFYNENWYLFDFIAHNFQNFGREFLIKKHLKNRHNHRPQN